MTAELTTELTYLALTGLLTIIALAAAAIPVNIQFGVAWTVSARDDAREPGGVGGRLFRAYRNHMEWLPLYAIGVILVELTGSHSGVTATAAAAYFWARLVYLPAYAAGIPYLRSAVWTVGFVATIVLLLAALL